MMRRAEWQYTVLSEIRTDLEAQTGEVKEDPFGPPLVGDFGYWHDKQDVRRAVSYLRNYGIMPSQWENEDQRWLDDLDTYVSLEHRLLWEVKNGVPLDGDEPPSDNPKLVIG